MAAMSCPRCGGATKVTRTTEIDGRVFRWRLCVECGLKKRTREAWTDDAEIPRDIVESALQDALDACGLPSHK